MTINSLSCKIIDKKGKKAEIEIEGQVIGLPSEFLPVSAKVGDEISIRFLTTIEGRVQEKELAQAILTEILNGK